LCTISSSTLVFYSSSCYLLLTILRRCHLAEVQFPTNDFTKCTISKRILQLSLFYHKIAIFLMLNLKKTEVVPYIF